MQRKYKVCCNKLLAIGCWPVFTTAAKRQFFTPVGLSSPLRRVKYVSQLIP